MHLTFDHKLLRVMRLTSIILLTCCLHVAAKTSSQTVTYSGNNVPLEQVFQAVKQQTGYVFIYDPLLIDRAKPVTVSASDMPLENFLQHILGNQQLEYVFKDRTIVIQEKAMVQSPVMETLPIAGVVKGIDGKPLANVSVVVKGTSKGTTTDAEGKFNIDVNPGEVLVVSSVGFGSKEVKVNTANKELIIALEMSSSPLDEVQIIAYGETSRRLNTGNVTTVKSEAIEKQPVNNPLLALQGRVPGVIISQSTGLPGSPVTLQIRGRNTLNPSNKNEPLYVVDGVPYGNNLPGGSIMPGLGALGNALSPMNFIHSSDIESIDVLKDADATSIYGSRGSNGVVIITTKKGKAAKTRVDVNIQSGFSEVANTMDLLNSRQYVEMRKEALKNDNFLDRLEQPEFWSEIYPDLLLWDQERNTDWQKELIGGNADYKDIQASISGGNSLLQYRIGGTFHRETTVFPGTSYDRKASGFFSLVGHSENERLQASVTANYMAVNSQFPSTDLTELAITLPPNAPLLFLADGNLNWEPNPYSGLSSWSIVGDGENPLVTLKRKHEAKQYNLLSSADVSYSILPGLSIKAAVGYSQTRGNSFKGSPGGTGDPALASIIGDFARNANFHSNTVNTFNFTPQLNFNKNWRFGSVKFLLGADLQTTSTESQSIGANGFTSDALIRSLAAAQILSASSGSSEYKYNAVFSRVTFSDPSNKYIVNVNARRDGSSRFGPGKQFGNFGSIGAAYTFSYENAIKSLLPFLSFGKLRMSYGSSGNDGNADYKYLEQYTTTSGELYQGVRGFQTLGLFNSSYGWETTRKMEAGLDLGFWNDRLLLQVSAYRYRSDDQLLSSTYPAMAGFGDVLVNFPALIQNTGLEFLINGSIFTNRHFAWSSTLNVSINRNKLAEFPGLEISPYASQFEIGEPFSGVIHAYQFAGINPHSGQYQFTDVAGKTVSDPNDYSRLDFGQHLRIMTAPKYYGGWRNSFSCKGLTLDVLLQFTRQLGTNPDYQLAVSPGTALLNRSVEVVNRWQKPGDEGPTQRYSINDGDNGLRTSYNWVMQSNKGYTDASFVRVKNVSLSYTIPKSVLGKTGIQTIKVYVNGQNLYTLTDYPGLDPETQNFIYLPPLRSIVFGLQITL